MNIHTYIDEKNDLSGTRQTIFLTKLFAEIVANQEQHEGLIDAWLSEARDHEANDGFGTEGFNG